MSADTPPSRPAGPELKSRRAEIHQSVSAAGRGLALIMAAVLVLAVGAIILGARAVRQEQRAEAAELTAREQLRDSYLAQARAVRLTGRMGRRHDALAAISNAAAIRPSIELRNEVISSLALLDVTDAGLALRTGTLPNYEFDPLASRYAVADTKRIVHVWSFPEQKELFTLDPNVVLPEEAGAVQNIVFGTDGRYLAVRFIGGAVVVWNLADRQPFIVAGKTATNRLLGTLQFDSQSGRITFANADRDGKISSFDLTTGREMDVIEQKVSARYFRLASGATNLIAVATDQNVELHDLVTGKRVADLVHSSRVVFFRWAESGRRLFVICTSGEIYDWNVPRQSYRILSGHGETCMTVLPLPDGETLMTGSRDGTSRIWDLRTGRTMIELARGILMQLSPDGQRAVYWQPGVGYGHWGIRRAEAFETRVTDPGQGGMSTFDLSSDRQWAVSTQPRGFQLWHMTGDYERFFPVEGFSSARFALDGRSLFICRTNGLELWPFEFSRGTNGKVATVNFGAIKKFNLPAKEGVRAMTLAKDGRTAAVEAGDYAASVLDLRGERAPVTMAEKPTGRWARGPAVPTGGGRFALSHDGRWFAQALGFGNQPVVFDATTGKRVATLSGGSGNLLFNPAGDVLLVATSRSFDFYSTTNWQRIRQLERDEASITFGAVAISGDGELAAITPSRQTIRILKMASGETVAEFQSPDRQAISSLRWSTDGNTLVAATADDNLQIWRFGQLRTELSALGLDWAQDDEAATKNPRVVTAQRAWSPPLAIGLMLVAIAGVAAMLVLRRHRSVVREYLETEALADRHRRELDAATAELMHSQKMQALGTVATGIAHDFNNLLSVIRMSNKLIGRATKANADVQENVGEIEQAVLQGKNVVGSMLGYARSEDGAGEPTDVCATVENAVSLLSKEFLSGLALNLELDRNALHVNVSRGRLEQVLLNLIVNASEAMQGKGRLKIAVRPRTQVPPKHFVLRPGPAAQLVELGVTDSGPGIPPEIRDRLFEPFFTTKRSGTKAGTGLGLSLVYSIAQQDAVGLAVESEPGKGATFTLLMPVREMHSSQKPPSS